MDNQNINPNAPVNRISTTMKVMLIIGFVSFTFQLLTSISIYIFQPLLIETFEKIGMPAENMEELLLMLEHPFYMPFHIGITIIALAGSLIMWQMKKIGFYVYMIGKIFILADAYIFGVEEFNLFGFIFEFVFWSIWPIFYLFQLKEMK